MEVKHRRSIDNSTEASELSPGDWLKSFRLSPSSKSTEVLLQAPAQRVPAAPHEPVVADELELEEMPTVAHARAVQESSLVQVILEDVPFVAGESCALLCCANVECDL